MCFLAFLQYRILVLGLEHTPLCLSRTASMCPFMRVSASSSVSIFLHDCFRYGLLSRTQWYAVPDYSCCLYSSYAMLVFRLLCLLRPFASWAATLALWATLPTPLRRFLLRDVQFSLPTLALFFHSSCFSVNTFHPAFPRQ